jgi:hypothetical protein
MINKRANKNKKQPQLQNHNSHRNAKMKGRSKVLILIHEAFFNDEKGRRMICSLVRRLTTLSDSPRADIYFIFMSKAVGYSLVKDTS